MQYVGITNFGHLVDVYLSFFAQNIDSLESRLALSTDLSNPKTVRVVQLHGDLDHVTCTHCKTLLPFDNTHMSVFNSGTAPECPSCVSAVEIRTALGKRTMAIGTLRPNVVLYNEHHSQGHEIAELAASDVRKRPDMLIVMGTSLKVDGVRRLVKDLAKAVHSMKSGVVVLVNRTELGKEWSDVFDYYIKGDSDAIVDLLEGEVKKLDEAAALRQEKAAKTAALKLSMLQQSLVNPFDGTPSVATVFKAKKPVAAGAATVKPLKPRKSSIKGKAAAFEAPCMLIDEDEATESDYSGMTDQGN
jgi:NAD-dependent histone deacetylase SIR2